MPRPGSRSQTSLSLGTPEERQPAVDAKLVERLRREHRALREGFEALLRFLEKRGIASHAAVSNERFAAVRRRFPLGGPSPTLPDVLDVPDIGLLEAVCEAGGLKALKATCTRGREQVQAAQAERLYLLGGQSSRFGAGKASAEALDLRRGAWSPVPGMRFPRIGCVSGVLHGSVYVCGGAPPTGNLVERFNPRTQEWETKLPTMKKHRAFAAAAVVAGRLTVCGGEDISRDLVHSSVETYQRTADGKGSWVLEALEMPAPRRNMAAAEVPGASPGGLLVCGGIATPSAFDGSSREGPLQAHAHCLEAGGEAWQRLPPLQVPRMGHGAAALQGRVYVCGGRLPDGSATMSVECFDGAVGAWLACAPMPLARGGCAVAALGEQLYVLGGVHDYAGTKALSRVDRYHPGRGTWEPFAEMLEGRQVLAAATVKVAALAKASASEPCSGRKGSRGGRARSRGSSSCSLRKRKG